MILIFYRYFWCSIRGFSWCFLSWAQFGGNILTDFPLLYNLGINCFSSLVQFGHWLIPHSSKICRLAIARSSSACQTSSFARLSGWIQSHPGRAKWGKAVMTPERLLLRFALAKSSSACQTSLLARLSGWIQSLPGRAKRGKTVMIPEWSLIQLYFFWARTIDLISCLQISACQTS